jgi:hypothetical protein
MAKGNAVPTRVIAGQKTLLGRDAHDIRYDAVHDEIYVTNRDAEAVMVFRGGASGEEPPIRVIQGPHTQMSTSEEDRVEVDPVNNELFVPTGDAVLVFPRDANGDVAPIRVLKGPHTRFRTAAAVAVDAIHNLMVIGGVIGSPPLPRSANGGGAPAGSPNAQVGGLLIYVRTADGDTPAKAAIGGPKSGVVRIQQIQVYPPKGWIVATQPGLTTEQAPKDTWIGIWSINDDGDVPPHWKVGGPKSQMVKPRGVAIDPKHKELIVADMRLNAVLTYYLPEMF